jgi:hypothetical protein
MQKMKKFKHFLKKLLNPNCTKNFLTESSVRLYIFYIIVHWTQLGCLIWGKMSSIITKLINIPVGKVTQSSELKYVPPRPVILFQLSLFWMITSGSVNYIKDHERSGSGSGRHIPSHSDTLYIKSRQQNGRQWGTKIDTEKALVFYWNIMTVCPARMWIGRQ